MSESSKRPDLAEQSLADFLDSVGAATPAPGAGSSSGVVAAIAAGLVEMCAQLAKRDDDAAAAAGLRRHALAQAQLELTSYAPVLEARTPEERELALQAASEPPARIAELAADVAELGVDVAAGSSKAVRGDALTGVILAEAAASAAFRLVEINVGSGPVFERARAAELRAVGARASASGHAPPPPRPPIPR